MPTKKKVSKKKPNPSEVVALQPGGAFKPVEVDPKSAVCETCEHWVDTGDYIGNCYLNPPTVLYILGQYRFVRPATEYNEHCGQHAFE